MATSPQTNSPSNDGEEISLGKCFRNTIASFLQAKRKKLEPGWNPFLSGWSTCIQFHVMLIYLIRNYVM